MLHSWSCYVLWVPKGHLVSEDLKASYEKHPQGVTTRTSSIISPPFSCNCLLWLLRRVQMIGLDIRSLGNYYVIIGFHEAGSNSLTNIYLCYRSYWGFNIEIGVIFRPVNDYNEIASHFIECIYVHVYNSRLQVLA